MCVHIALNNSTHSILIISRIIGAIKYMEEILLSEKEMVFLALWFHGNIKKISKLGTDRAYRLIFPPEIKFWFYRSHKLRRSRYFLKFFVPVQFYFISFCHINLFQDCILRKMRVFLRSAFCILWLFFERF